MADFDFDMPAAPANNAVSDVPANDGGFDFDAPQQPAAPVNNFQAAPPAPAADTFVNSAGESPLEKFNRETQQRLATKDADTEARTQEVRAKAAAYLKKVRAERETLIAGKKAANENEESAKTARRDELFSVGTTWQRVVSMVDLHPDEKKAKKVQRMKQIFQYMQEEGNKA
eukprot:PhF_6_TR24133/c0_g1_i1/m.33676